MATKKKSILKAMSNNEDGIPYSDRTSEKMRTNKKGQKIYKTKTRTKDGYVEKSKKVVGVDGSIVKERKVKRKTAPKFIKDVFTAIKNAKAKKDVYSQKASESAAKGASESAGFKSESGDYAFKRAYPIKRIKKVVKRTPIPPKKRKSDKENAKSLEPGANLNPVPQSIKGKMAPRKWTKTNIKELAQKDYEMNKKKT